MVFEILNCRLLKMIKRRKNIICFAIITSVIMLYFYTSNKFYAEPESFIHEIGNISKSIYVTNNNYLINQNVAQYSSYITTEYRNKTKFYKITVHIKLNTKKVIHYGDKSSFKCIVNLLISRKYYNIELEAFEEHRIFTASSKKLVFVFDPNIVKKKIDFKSNLDIINKVMVAVIWINNYDKYLNENKFLEKIHYSNVKLPYSLINFQKPTIINTIEPRLPSVGMCVSYCYAVPSQIFNWFDYHLSIGIREIVVYDSMEDKKLTQVLKANYGEDERINIIPYNISLHDLCDEKRLFNQYTKSNFDSKIKNYLVNSCKEFYNDEFRERYEWRYMHEEISANDCFTFLKEKHEFIAYYDFDEFVFTRQMDLVSDFYSKNIFYSCNRDNRFSMCEFNPFKSKKGDHYYTYLNNLIEIERHGRDRNKLGSIKFVHAYYMPYDVENNLIKDIGLLIEKIEKQKNSLSSIFPLYLYITSESYNTGHLFSVEMKDIEYIKYLYKAYNTLISCVKEHYNKSMNLDTTLIRHLFYISERKEREEKEVHYYKNVKSVFVHYALDKSPNAWDVSPSIYSGHILSHFRPKLKFDNFNATGSVQKLNIDFEYVFFVLKQFSQFCNF